ncbi:(2Fe-2S) ferredoxin domain-containing protein [bacterium]|nr:(2Fe-2S) ferredoxin domain-containing protein [bacterium]NCQ55165.1 (2Fe-2S) ferredoxin domain-containing protein [Candidatus Parcubacteria bacterium]NCS67322.1 (2Fe-2S) ferredoxin domain-containing protein [Candidatus Peregrinibacteria bacterium]NCS96577.1 (2Fe-2S) ferredoxin domain-containing protein [bacterium]
MNRLKICTGRVCSDYGSAYLFDRAKAELAGSETALKVEPCACLGKCESAVNVRFESDKDPVDYSNVTGPGLAEILKNILKK